MELQEAKELFVQAWGTLGSNWGINRTMAQIHALLLISTEAQSAEEIAEKLNISGGNVSMNVRELMDWGLVQKELKPGERKEFFSAEKDIWEVAKCIVRERKRRELDTVKKTIDQLAKVEGDKKDKEFGDFLKLITEIQELIGITDKFLNQLSSVEKTWLTKKLLKLFV